MVYQGTVQNGVVVFENGIRLPEGTAVRVEPLTSGAQEKPHSPKDDILFRMAEYAVDTGVPDLSENINHYLYGHPKVTDEK